MSLSEAHTQALRRFGSRAVVLEEVAMGPEPEAVQFTRTVARLGSNGFSLDLLGCGPTWESAFEQAEREHSDGADQ